MSSRLANFSELLCAGRLPNCRRPHDPPASPLQLHNPHHFTHEKTNMKDHVPSEGKLGREAKLCFPGQCSFHSLGLATETSRGGPGRRPSAQDVYTVMLSGVS